MVFSQILKRLERAATQGERLHLDPEQVRALIGSPIYGALLELKAKEIAALWQSDTQAIAPSHGGSSSTAIGSTTAPTAASGPSAGTMSPPERGAGEARAYAEAQRMHHLKTRGRRSRIGY